MSLSSSNKSALIQCAELDWLSRQHCKNKQKTAEVSATARQLNCILASSFLLLFLHRQEKEIQLTENLSVLQKNSSVLLFPVSEVEEHPLESAIPRTHQVSHQLSAQRACGECFSFLMLEFGSSPDV